VAQRLGVDAETLRSLNPDLIYLDAPGYGTDGPCAQNPAFAATIGAAAGLAMRNVGPSIDERPDLTLDQIMDGARRLVTANMNGYAQSDGFSALGVATAMLLGLLVRERGGGSRTMRTSMLLTNAHALSEQMIDYLGKGPLATADPELHGFDARYRLYEAANQGWIFLAATAESDWAALATVMDQHGDLSGDDRFATEEARHANNAALAQVLAGIFVGRTANEWERDLTAVDVGCVAVSSEPVEAVLLGDDFGRGAGMVVDVVHPTFDEHPRLAPLVSLSRSATVAGVGCLLGQHTDSVLQELGYDQDAITELRAAGVVA
jgi:crotonobetainyl-CoA:carnitine CoA-transferase CaiB-like acyl-CoA transferase